MNTISDVVVAEVGERQTWLVGAFIGSEDRTSEFVSESRWEVVNPTDKDQAMLNAMRPGDRIAIKSSFVQRHDLPFDNRNLPVSVLRIKARGVIRRVSDTQLLVDWQEFPEPRDWYLYTYRATIWLLSDDEQAEHLKRFIFEDEPQDLQYFLSRPYWMDRFRSDDQLVPPPDKAGYDWIPFFEAMADALAEWSQRRPELVTIVSRIRKESGHGTWHDMNSDGTTGPLADIDPFTVMNIFNFGPTGWKKRQEIAQRLATAVGLDLQAPAHFEGVPITHPQNAWLFKWAKDRDDDAIDNLWSIAHAGLAWADARGDLEKRAAFAEALKASLPQSNWTLATGLYRARPMHFCPMDTNTRAKLPSLLGVLKAPHPQDSSAVDWYMDVLDRLHVYTATPGSEFASIPELSDAAWAEGVASKVEADEVFEDDGEDTPIAAGGNETDEPPEPPRPYTVDDIVKDGCFVPRAEIEQMLEVLSRGKNLILQGAPGTGKTWLAKRLGWAMTGHRPTSSVQVVQFHPNTSYEDFIRGYRPVTSDDGAAGLKLVDGPFLRLADRAHQKGEQAFTMVIEEINRGNPARALGEMLTLLEPGQRNKSEAMRLTYHRDTDNRGIWLPPNLYVIGTMNIADRSLALVDLALRRRFAFRTLRPQFNGLWRQWVLERTGDSSVVNAVGAAATTLNNEISADPALGPQFVIGHSYFTPAAVVPDPQEWFHEQVDWSIRPLLHEYWFDRPERADEAADALKNAWPRVQE